MQRCLLVSLFSLLLWLATPLGRAAGNARALPVLVSNPSFEEDELFCNGCYYPAITGWFVGPNSGVQKTNVVDFPNGLPGGVNFAYVGNGNSTGSISQTLSTTVHSNTTYTLRMSIGQQLGIALTGYLAALRADGMTLASDNSVSPAPGTFLDEVIVYKTGPNPAQLGKPLTIFVKSLGNGQVDVDNVSLTAQ